MTESLQTLQAVIDANEQPVFALDANLRYTAFNRAHAAVMRDLYDAEIAIGGRLTEYQTVEADRESAVANLERVLAGEQVTAMASSGEGGRRRSFEVVCSPQVDGAGEIVGVVVQARDVSEHRQVEAALSQDRTLLAAIVEGTSDAVYVKDNAGRYLLFNAAAERVTGKRVADVLGKDDRFLFPPDEADVVMAGDRAVMDGAESTTYEETVTDATGKRSTFLSTKGPIFDNDGELLGLFGIARDISERRRAEEQVLESQTYLQATLDSAAEGILAVDNSGRVVEANRRFAELWQVPDDLLARKDEEAVLAFVMDQLADPETFLSTVRSLRGSDATDADTLTFRDGRIFERHSSATMQGSVVTGRVWSFDDITERVAAERELRASEERFRIAAETANDVVYEWDLKQRVQWWGKIDEMLGYEPDEFPRTLDGWASAVHPEDLERTMAQIQAHLERGDPYDAEYRVLRKDGVYRWWSARGAAARTPDGMPLRLIGSITDVTERKRAEGALAASEALYRTMGEAVDYGVWATDADGRAVYISPSFCELVGKSFDEIREFGWLDVLVPEQRAEVERLWLHSVATGEPFEHEHHFVAKSGEIRVVLARGKPVRDEYGQVVAWAGINLDITERKRGEAELRETRDYLENLFGYANAPVIVWDPELRVTRFNRAFEELTQRAASEVVGRHLELLFPEDDRRREALAHVTQASAGERWQVVEIPILRADGAVRTVLWNSATIYAADGATPVATIAQGQDITERVAAEQSLRESEDKFKYIFDYSSLGKSITLPTGEIHVNRAFCEMVGYSQVELEHTRWQDITPPEDVELTQRQLDPILSGQSDRVRFVKRYRHKDGSIVWADVATSLRRDEAGEPLYFVTAVRDITEQRLAQESLRTSEERYRELVDHMSSGVVVYEPTPDGMDFLIREFNAAAQHIEQLNRDEVVGRPLTDAFPGVEEFGLLEVLRRVARTGEPEEFPTAFYQDQRLASWRENHIYRLPSGEVVAVYEDVTERVLAEREAAHAKELMERAEEIGHAGGWEYDVAAERVTWTDEVYRIHGLGPDYDPNDAGRDIDFYSPEDAALVAEAFREAVAEGEAYDLEVELDRADGCRIWVRTIGRPVVEDGAVVRVLGNIMDISERRRAEAEVLRLNAELEQRVADRTAQLEAVNKELEAFAYSVSHDLRAPLRHISGYASILATDAADVLDDDGLHCLDTISESVREMGVLIDDLLQFSRVGRAEMTIGPVDMEQVLAEALGPIREEAVDRTIEWSIGPLPSVTGDPALLRQVWANLLGNAVKYSRDRDPARIEVGGSDGATASADGASHEYVFFVRDNGVGFDMQYAHKLFGVFQRLHSSAEFEGTGIGLANVERIVTRHGGRAWAEAEPEKGATFYFALPRPKEN
jgi:PAS domain S-box-containing protein